MRRNFGCRMSTQLSSSDRVVRTRCRQERPVELCLEAVCTTVRMSRVQNQLGQPDIESDGLKIGGT